MLFMVALSLSAQRVLGQALPPTAGSATSSSS